MNYRHRQSARMMKINAGLLRHLGGLGKDAAFVCMATFSGQKLSQLAPAHGPTMRLYRQHVPCKAVYKLHANGRLPKKRTPADECLVGFVAHEAAACRFRPLPNRDQRHELLDMCSLQSVLNRDGRRGGKQPGYGFCG